MTRRQRNPNGPMCLVLPVALKKHLRKLAKKNRRSLTCEIVVTLEQYFAAQQPPVTEK